MPESQRLRPIDDLNLPVWVREDAKRLQAHPAFQSALRLHAELVSENFEKTSALIRIMSEEARYLICIALLAMHHSRDPHDPGAGATLTRLQAFAARFELTGPNRVAALVALMQHAGYLDQVRASSDRRVKRFEPTKMGLAIAEASTVATLKPIQLFSETHDYVQVMRDDTQFIGRYYSEGLRFYADGARLVSALPECHLFQRQNAGREVMFKLWIALTDKGRTAPAVVSCPYGQLARCFRVSRGHIRRMIEKGERQGLFTVHAPGGQAIGILPSFIHLHETLTALEFALMLRAADTAASTTGRAARLCW
ncbi:hypothetical protein ACFFWD_23050 [Bradyrhizobium erythrophlei]|uniref:hypothetical protein n=1 Tax=Bradyrhizobium erythrophlei TaxID=1437360 RepID=UPI0035E8A5A1